MNKQRPVFRLKLALFCVCLFCLAALGALLMLFVPESGRGGLSAPLIILSVLALLALYFMLRRLLLTPLLQLHTLLERYLSTGIRTNEVPKGSVIFQNLLRGFNGLVDSVRDEEARLTAACQDNQAKIAFLFRMSSEIAAPVEQIEAAARQLDASALNEQQSFFAGNAVAAAKKLRRLTEQIADYSAVESGKVYLESYPFRLDDVLAELAAEFRPICLEKKLDFIFAVPPDVPQELVGDRVRFSQVLRNILDNAFKFTESGEVFLGCTVEERNPRSTTLRFIVRDTGQGMTPEEMAWLFTAFDNAGHGNSGCQVEDAEVRPGGLGLGLAIARKLVQIMGGDINVRSVYGRGTSVSFQAGFGLYDPVLPESAGPYGLPAESATMLRGQRILVVAENSSHRLAIYDQLKNLVAFVEVAEEAEKARQILTESLAGKDPFSVVLVSQTLPGNGAFTLLHALADIRKSLRPSLKLVTILMGMENNPGPSVLESYGATAYLRKPLTSGALLDVVLSSLTGAGIGRVKNPEQDFGPVLKPDFSGHNLLLVEDNPVNEQIATEILLDLGVKLSVAHTGREALKVIQAAGRESGGGLPFDLVLMDIQMPEMDGVAATRIIRQNEQYGNMPIVAMTAHVMRKELEDYMAAGMNGHIAKPIDIEKLYGELGRFLKNRNAE